LKIDELKVGEEVKYSGELLVMRDAAQKRIKNFLERNKTLPLKLEGKIVFYAGPARSPDGKKCGAIGPTTSARMDEYLEMLYSLGVVATVGKGKRSNWVVDMCRKWKRVYFVTPSGAAAYLSRCVESIETVAFEDLGPEAIYRIHVKNFPLLVAIDVWGNTVFAG